MRGQLDGQMWLAASWPASRAWAKALGHPDDLTETAFVGDLQAQEGGGRTLGRQDGAAGIEGRTLRSEARLVGLVGSRVEQDVRLATEELLRDGASVQRRHEWIGEICQARGLRIEDAADCVAAARQEKVGLTRAHILDVISSADAQHRRDLLQLIEAGLLPHVTQGHDQVDALQPGEQGWPERWAPLVAMADAGAKAVATSSAAVAWSHGYPDGDALPLPLLLATISAVARVVSAPVTADIEGGYTDDLGQLGETIKAVIGAGAVGINLEDGRRDPDLHARKIEAARKAADATGVPLFINARTDVYLKGLAEGEAAYAETVRRAERYRAAGASGIFVPGP